MKVRPYILLLVTIAVLSVYCSCQKKYVASKNTYRLDSLIAMATQIADTAKEGPEPGLFPVGAISQLQMMIDSAKTLEQSAVTQFKIDLAENLLQNEITNFESSVQIEKQLYFDGTGYLDGGPDSAFTTAGITVEAWVYPTFWKNAMYVISTEGNKSGYKLQVPSAIPTFQMGTGSGTVTVAATDTIKLNQWAHLAASFDGSKVKLYVNGQLAAQANYTGQILPNTQNFRIGEGSLNTGRTFEGRIRDVRIWSSALSDANIASSLNTELSGAEEGLIAWWPFNLSAGTTVLDRTGKHSVTLINMQYVDGVN